MHPHKESLMTSPHFKKRQEWRLQGHGNETEQFHSLWLGVIVVLIKARLRKIYQAFPMIARAHVRPMSRTQEQS